MVEGPVSGRRIKRRTVRNLVLLFIGLIVLLAAWQGASYFMSKMQEQAREQRQATMEAEAGDLARSVSESLATARDQLVAIAGRDDVLSLFAEGDKSGLAELADKLTSENKAFLKLRLLLPGGYALDRDSRPPLGFASLDLLKQVEESGRPADAELHGHGGDDAHVVMIQPVTGKSDELLGMVHASIAPESYTGFGDQTLSINGYAELVQATASKQVVLDKLGNADYRSGNPVSVKVDGSRWKVLIWDDSSTATAAGSGGFSNYLLPLAILVLLVGAWVIYRRKQAASEGGGTENVVYGGAVKAIMDGTHPGLEKLIPNLPKMGQKKEVKPVSQGMDGDDITHIASKNDISQKARAAVDAGPPPAPDTGVEISEGGAGEASAQQAAPAAGATTPEVPPEPPATPETPPAAKPAATPAATGEKPELSPVIFRAYDIRGEYGKNLTAPVVQMIGQAIGSEAGAREQKVVAVGRDGRKSSPELAEALIKGLRMAGIDVIDIGLVPTPVLYFATHHLECQSGVMLTGSHNGPEYNGLKIVLGDETLSEKAIQSIRERIESGNLATGQGGLETREVHADYIRRITDDIPVSLGGAFKLVIDCGNGAAGAIAPQLFRALGHDVVELYCEIDGSFPNHHPDPSQPENMQDLINKVKEEQADLGLAFDGDGDRLGVVDSDGNIIWPDQQLMLLAKDVLSRNKGKPIIFDVKCSRFLKGVIESSGGVPLMWKTGHSLIKAKMKEEDAPLAGEMSGHIFFKERWYGFDDAIYTAARLIEVLTNSKEKPANVFANLPTGVSTPELRIPLKEKYHSKFMQAMKKKMAFDDAEISEIDGVRVDFADGWGLIRPSNTSPCLIARFEANDEAGLERIKSEFSNLIKSITPDLKLPF